MDRELAALVPTYLSGEFAEIAGPGMARTAAEICAAGGHNLSLLGPPCSGAVLLAEVSLAHRGVLFLEDAPEYHPTTTFGNADLREGIKAFIDKREPHFHGE